MKKTICITLCVLMLFTLAACGNEPQNAEQGGGIVEQPVSSEQAVLQKNEKEPCIKELYGYEYALPDEAVVYSSNGGEIIECMSSGILVFPSDRIDFSGWESVVEDSESRLFKCISSAFGFYPNSQTVTAEQSVKNDNDEELLRIEGTFETSDGDREFMAYYHVTAENKVRFFVTLLDDDKEEAISIMEYIADHLTKV